MNRYFRLANLVELMERKIASIDERSEYVLYTEEKYKKIANDMSTLLEDVTNTEPDLQGFDDRFKEQFRAEFKDIRDRAAVALKILSLADKTKEAIENSYYKEERGKSLAEVEPIEEDPDLNKRNEKIGAAKNALAKTLRFKNVIAEVKKDLHDGKFSTKNDPARLDDIHNGYDDKAKGRLNALSKNSGIYRSINMMINQGKDSRENVLALMENGSLQRVFQVKSSGDFKSDSVPGIEDAKATITDIINSPQVNKIINNYKAAEKFWLATAENDVSEKDSRRAFVEAHEDELKALYHAANVAKAEEKSAVLNLLRENGIVNLVKDYHDMILDRRLEKEGKGDLSDDNRSSDEGRWTKNDIDDNYKYLYEGENNDEKIFRAIQSKSSLSSGMAKIGDNQASEAQLLGLKEFHKWIYRNCDERGFGDAFGANSSARSYMESFMKKPYDVQIKTLYMLEHRNRKTVPSDEQIKDYVPSLSDIKGTMVSTRFKFWRRLNGKKHRWNKVKECIDRIDKEARGVKDKPAKEKSRFEKNFEVINKATAQVNKVELGIDVLRNANNAVNHTYKMFNNMNGNAYVNTAGTVGNVYWAGTAIYDTGKNAIRTVKAFHDGKKQEGFAALLDTVSSGATVYTAEKFAVGATKAAINAGTAVSIFGLAQSSGALINGWSNWREHRESVENKFKFREKNIRTDLQKKLKKHENAIAGINYGKRHNQIINLTQGGIGVTNGLAGGAYGWWTGAAASAIAPWSMLLVIIGIPIFALVRNKYAAVRTNKVADKLLYDEEDKQKILKSERKKITRRVNRISGTPDMPGDEKLIDYLNSVKNSDTAILNKMRKQYATKKGCVNEKQLKGVLVKEMSKDLRNMHYMQDAANSEEAKVMRQAADYLTEKAGHHKIKNTEEKNLSEEDKEKEIAKIMKGL